MANRIKPKRSLTGSKVPDNLEQNELAINVTDKKIYVGGVSGVAILLSDLNRANNPFDQTLNKASGVTFSTITNGAIALINTKGTLNQVLASNGDGTQKWINQSTGNTLVDGSKILTFGNAQDNVLYFPANSPNGSAIRSATNEPFSILSYNDTGAGTLYKFKFQNSGMTFPDLTTQTTAFTGVATSLSSTLAVSAGGTGVTTGTGTGSVVLNTSPTLITPILGTPASGNLANCTFPVLNQSTTGNAATSTRTTINANLTGIVTSVGNATSIANGAIGNTLLANTAVANLSGINSGDNAVNSLYSGLLSNVIHTGDVTDTSGVLKVIKINNVLLSGLATGILKNTTTTGIPSIAVAADFPILNQNTVGTAAGLSTTLAVASGGTGVTIATGTGAVVLNISPSFITPILGTPVSGNLINCIFPILNQSTTGNAATATTITQTLAVSKGGTGLVAAGPSGNVLTSNGTTWISAANAGGISNLDGGAASSVYLGTQNITGGNASGV